MTNINRESATSGGVSFPANRRLIYHPTLKKSHGSETGANVRQQIFRAIPRKGVFYGSCWIEETQGLWRNTAERGTGPWISLVSAEQRIGYRTPNGSAVWAGNIVWRS